MVVNWRRRSPPPPAKLDHLYPALCEPNDGFGADGKWQGMTPEQLAEVLEDMRVKRELEKWQPDPGDKPS